MRSVRDLGGGAIVTIACAAIACVGACARGTDLGDEVLDDASVDAASPARDGSTFPEVDADQPGSDAGDDGASPPADAGCTGKVVINEVQTAGANASDEFVELFNPNSCAVTIGGWSIAYESSSGNAGGAGAKIPVGASVAAGGFYLVASPAFGAKDAPLTTGFAGTAGQIGLVDDKNKVVDAVAYGAVSTGDYREGQSAPAPATSGSIGRKPDGADTNDNKSDFKTFATPTPRAPN